MTDNLRDFVERGQRAQAAADAAIDEAHVRATYQQMTRPQLEMLHTAFTLDRAALQRDPTKLAESIAFCDRRLKVIEELLA